MAEYDGLPLNTPTKVATIGDVEVWATRTKNGGTVEGRPIAGSATALSTTVLATLSSKAVAAIAANNTYIAIASPTATQVAAQVKLLSRECNALIRLLLNRLDADDA